MLRSADKDTRSGIDCLLNSLARGRSSLSKGTLNKDKGEYPWKIFKRWRGHLLTTDGSILSSAEKALFLTLTDLQNSIAISGPTQDPTFLKVLFPGCKGAGVKRLAIDLRSIDRSKRSRSLEDLNWVYHMDLKELIFVVEQDKKSSMSSSVRLVEPQQSFPIFRASLSKQGELFWGKELCGKQTWEDIAVEDKKRLEEQKKPQTSVWDLLIAYNSDLTHWGLRGSRDLANWVVPQIQFMDICFNAGSKYEE
ncbi:hypothetical protein DL95DRAFT_405294 [Leptodontidium sp. 2 PMI_412]|nr:hypothetical protein DL95DRAFT_405294 [Leptodontidium sp. 2 PMI_412]